MRYRIVPPAMPLFRESRLWRAVRLVCAVWFAITSLGIPLSFSSNVGTSCAVNPEKQCRCSLAKRVSGTCCCGKVSQPETTKTCCSGGKAVAAKQQIAEQSKSCHPKKAASGLSQPQLVELSVEACDCGSDIPGGISNEQQPRLPVSMLSNVMSEHAVFSVSVLNERVESALLSPPVPPPKVVG